MLTKIAGIVLLGAGVVLGLHVLGAALRSAAGMIGLAVVIGLVAAAVYIGWRLLQCASMVARVIGALVLTGAVLGAIPAILSLVAGAVWAVLLLAGLGVVALLVYLGWRLLHRDAGSALETEDTNDASPV